MAQPKSCERCKRPHVLQRDSNASILEVLYTLLKLKLGVITICGECVKLREEFKGKEKI